MTDLVGIREAARALGRSPSTITRYLQTNPELNRGTPDQPAVDLGELRAHRDQNVNHLKSRSHAGELFDESDGPGGDLAGQSAPASPPPDNQAQTPKGAYSTAKAAREAIAARRAQVELDEKLNKLVSRTEVEQGADALGGVLQTALLQLSVDLAEPLATMTEPAEIAALLDKNFRQLLDRLSAQVEEIAREMQDAAA